MDLKNKVAIVTGSGGPGSGRAEALRLAREGCRVVVSDIDQAGAAKTVMLIKASGGVAEPRPCDVRRESEIAGLIEFAERVFGGLDIVVNNASPPFRPKEPFEHWQEIVEGDLLGPMHAILHALPAMRKRGGGAV